jgi:hypothetical protein
MSFDRPPHNAAKGPFKGPTQIGQFGVYRGQKGDSWYVVTKVGERGGTGGCCVAGPFTSSLFVDQLRSRTEFVPDDQVPDFVVAASAARALIGKVPGANN